VSSYGAYVAETFITLLLVCVVAAAVLYGARRLGVGRARGPIELVGQLPLDARRAVYLVRVGTQVLVVGASEAGLTRLGEVEGTSIPKDDPDDKSPFKDVLARLRGGSKREKKNADSDAQSASPEKLIDTGRELPPGTARATPQARPIKDDGEPS
jgi:flagellar biogenesis protein FliO